MRPKCNLPPGNNLKCKRLANPKILFPKNEDNTKGSKLLQTQEDQKVEWQEYTFQEVVDSVEIKFNVAAVDMQYAEELEEDYVGYRNQTIIIMVTQLRTWCIITTKENLAIKEHSLAPWSDTPKAHITTFLRQLDQRQVKYEYHGVTVTNDDKVDNLVAQMKTRS